MWHRCILFLSRSISTMETIDQKLLVWVQENFFLSLMMKLCNILFLSKVMFFSCYKNENISYTKYPMSTYPTKKITLACYVCLCIITGAASLFLCHIVKTLNIYFFNVSDVKNWEKSLWGVRCELPAPKKPGASRFCSICEFLFAVKSFCIEKSTKT